jgi:hypothetical protein
MNRTNFFTLVCAGLLISSLFLAGCVRDRGSHGAEPASVPGMVMTTTPGTTATPQPSAVPAPSGKTCAALGGDICTAGEDCSGAWLNAKDAFSCCSRTCSGSAGSGTIVTIVPFEPSATMEEQDPITP